MPPTRPTATLRAVDSNQPQLVHSSSQQSVAASDDYYSLSDNNTVNSSRSKISTRHYETPPSRNISPPENVANPQSHSSVSLPARNQTTRTQAQNRPVSLGQDNSRPAENNSPSPGVDDSPYIRFAIDQLTRDEELRGKGRQGSVMTTDYPVDRVISDERLAYYSAPGTRTSEREPLRQSYSSSERSESPGPADILVAAQPPDDTYRYPSLDFVPYSLRSISLCTVLILCLSTIAALVFCNIWSQRNDGLWDYNGFGGRRYFVFEFLPQILGISIVILLFVVQAAVYRISPLSIIARPGSKGTALQRLPILPKNFLLPDLTHFKHGEKLIGACLLVIWVINWITVPLHSCLFQPRFFGSVSEGNFRWTPSQGIVWMLVALYGLLVCALFAIMVRFSWSKTGLQWDPVCLADIIPLIQKSNILHEFDQSETSPAVEHHLPHRKLRLGYWRTSTRPGLFYTIGEENAPLWRESPRNSRAEKAPVRTSDDVDVERQELHTKGSFERNLHSPFVRYRWAPWFLKDTFLVAWIVIAIVLLVAFIAVSFVKHPIEKGFAPLLPTLTSITGFSSSNFLYSFIPALLGNFLFLAWQPIDVYFRAAQAYADLSSPRGSSAEKSLLLAYNSCLPLETTIVALFARHFKVAYISFISIASLAIPVLAGGIFMARFDTSVNQIRISSYLPAYYTLVAFLIVYALSFLLIWPRRKRYLPHPVETYADIISFLYQSSLLADKVFREPRTKSDLVTRAIVAPPGQSEKASYTFGVYYGQDGREHLGIDRLRKSERGTSTEWEATPNLS